ncbi:MAG: bifunctional tRNA (5-methylaminomethyl-2-thiouridine)(34)-methyltransferase MnmD/FAD-dependent 5-carboxymethylaminomethyl-2-thiouridine(34) oxidoreductase MnmC [Pseudomonadota bacterium]
MNDFSGNDSAKIHNAILHWDDQGQPVSSSFGDIYFSSASGLEESRHVFLQHNQLSERWKTLKNADHFTIGETGFGSGLNFLAAWDLWLKVAPVGAQLHFVSVEKFPLVRDDLIRALALWPELTHLSAQLISAYPDFVGNNFHRLNFMDGRIKLTLIIDDAALGLSKLLATTHPLFARTGAKVDAWFLDGFAPSKNPAMWSDELFDCINKLSYNLGCNQTSAATFSAAAIVKNGLVRAGFSIQKVTGFGRKREMVKAIFNAQPESIDANQFTYRGSFSPYPVPWTIQQNRPTFSERHAVIIGGGLAGCHSARALAERGWRITLMERNKQLAQGGSGNLQGVLYAKLSPLSEAQAAFNLASLEYALRFYQNLWPAIGNNCGVLQLAYKSTEIELHKLLHERFAQAGKLVEFVDAERASDIAGVKLSQSGLYFPDAGWINAPKLCAQLIDHPNIQVIYQTEALTLKREDNGWQVLANNGPTMITPVVIIATAKDALDFPQANHLPIKSIRGQVTYLPPTAEAKNLKTVVCAEGYICPQGNGVSSTGATFNLNDTDTGVRTSDHQTNLDNLREHIPSLAENWSGVDASGLNGRVGFRCTLPDYLPAIGALPIIEDLVRNFAPLRKNARAGIITPGSYLPGLYINIGHGARGLTYTPLCAEILASQINNELLPVPMELANSLNPARFVIRALVRNKL